MRTIKATGFVRTAALLAPFVVSGVVGQSALPARAQSDPFVDSRALRVAPGRVVMSVTPTGSWKFGARGSRLLVETGTVVVYSTGPDGNLVERMSSTAGTKSLLPSGGVAMVQEGAPGGTRYPSSRADDDNDGRIDEDPLDRIDNDRDGRTDEDFAAIGDAMAVVKFGPASTNGTAAAIAVRQEVYAWSLPHIDRMAASTIFVRNAGTTTLSGVRVGVAMVPGEAIADNRLLARSTQRAAGDFATANVMLRGNEETLAALLFAKGGEANAEWDVRDDGERVLMVSPVLGDLAPGAVVTIHMALLAATSDDIQTTRAVQSARRTVLGDGTARMIPPPVSLSSQTGDNLTPDRPEAASSAAMPSVDTYWLAPGKLEEILLGGSPNPFHDAITIDYEIPTRAMDEDGVEHILSGSAVPTSVKVYNVTGRLIATLVESTHAPGHYRTGWTAQTDQGASVASGVYYVKLTIGKRSVTKRLVQIK
jgi:hypothetical protein